LGEFILNTKKPIILIVDDEKDSLEFLREEALSKTHQKLDLILMDIRMPKLDGVQVCKQLKENIEYHNIPIILYSALLTEEHIEEGRKAGADAMLKKPFELKALIEVIKRKLGQ
jgi:CheY-like chemotaxis protein